jgi:WD40 repeat protein
LARFDGHTDQVRGIAALGWPGLDHPVVITASSDRTARVWDPREPGGELARFDGHTDEVRGIAALDWPGLDHAVIATTSLDGTARIWDPTRPHSELAQLTLLGEGHSAVLLGPLTLAIASSRGFLVFQLS